VERSRSAAKVVETVPKVMRLTSIEARIGKVSLRGKLPSQKEEDWKNEKRSMGEKGQVDLWEESMVVAGWGVVRGGVEKGAGKWGRGK